jgi:hypothetical protein
LFTGCGLNLEIHLRKRQALGGVGRHPGGVCSTDIPSEPGNGRYRLYGDIKVENLTSQKAQNSKKKNLERKHNHQKGKRDYRASWTLFLRSQHMSHLLHINRINRNSTLANHRLQVVDGPISGTVFHSLTPRPPRDVQARAAVLCTRLKHQVKDVMGNGQRVDCARGFIIVGRNVAEDQQEG